MPKCRTSWLRSYSTWATRIMTSTRNNKICPREIPASPSRQIVSALRKTSSTFSTSKWSWRLVTLKSSAKCKIGDDLFSETHSSTTQMMSSKKTISCCEPMSSRIAHTGTTNSLWLGHQEGLLGAKSRVNRPNSSPCSNTQSVTS